ncbi:MAG: hypothetical protein SH856_11230 [Flavobacteriales bacterium]|nr:hypothetical protein [Flavobacteriales bacterium]
MITYEVQITNRKAEKILKQLEELNLIKLFKRKKESPRISVADLAGTLSTEVTEALQKHITESREAWEKRT